MDLKKESKFLQELDLLKREEFSKTFASYSKESYMYTDSIVERDNQNSILWNAFLQFFSTVDSFVLLEENDIPDEDMLLLLISEIFSDGLEFIIYQVIIEKYLCGMSSEYSWHLILQKLIEMFYIGNTWDFFLERIYLWCKGILKEFPEKFRP